MPSPARARPRKLPQQARARATVEALLDATAHILATGGYGAVNTNRVAQEAGASIGSLYQYFPSKGSLLAALRRRHAEQMSQLLQEMAGQAMRLPLADAVGLMVHGVVQAHAIDPRLHRALEQEVPHAARIDDRHDLSRAQNELIRAMLRHFRADIRLPDLDLAAAVIGTTVDTLVHAAMLDRGATAAAMEQETTRLVLRYLGQDAP